MQKKKKCILVIVYALGEEELLKDGDAANSCIGFFSEDPDIGFSNHFEDQVKTCLSFTRTQHSAGQN